MTQRRSIPLVTLVLCLTADGAAGQAAGSSPDAQGRIVSLNGQVEHTIAQPEQWRGARILQPLLTAERVRTLDASRASILFVDETQVKLNAGAVLTIRDVRGGGGAPTEFDLRSGEAWFRTKNPRSGMTIRTPAAAAAVRGTEINLRIGSGGETVLMVVEGAAEFFNPQGSILVTAGEEGTAIPGQAPIKRVVLAPEDAVQWALYYPAHVAWRDLPAATAGGAPAGGFARLRGGDFSGALQLFDPMVASNPWAAVGASMAWLARGDTVRARAALDRGARSAETGEEWLAQMAAVLLAAGDVAAARSALDAALAANPTALRPLVVLSSLELRQNKADRAREAAERALAAHPDSVGALVAASDAAQARFDLDAARRALDRAIALDDRDVRALVNRARIRFGTGDAPGARADATRAAQVAADDAQVRSLRGFIELADGRVAPARADFEAAMSADPELGEPHLGLGLLLFREGRVDEGLQAMLTATLLEPNVSLYQSYLGKAYYQASRFAEGLSALASAKRLDPRDPTPWLYTSLYLRDQNRQVDALHELRQAIALNDNRAVYRGRLLLDRDLATKNVSLAEIYRQLGFAAWGAYEALNSLQADLTNASAHLFLADTYGNLPDRTQAQGSELLQYALYAPVNRNSFNNFAEYTALLEQPRRQLIVNAEAGSREYGFGGVSVRTGNERFAQSSFFEVSRDDSSRLTGDDHRIQGFFQGKVALGRRTDVLYRFNGVRDVAGAGDSVSRVFGGETATPVILNQFSPPNPRLTRRFRDVQSTLGIKHEWRPGSVLTATADYNDLETSSERTGSTRSLCSFLDLSEFGATTSGTIRNPFRALDFQLQQTTRIGRHQVVIGHQQFRVDKDDLCAETIVAGAESLDFGTSIDGRDTARITQVRDEIRLTRAVHLSLGLDHQQVSFDDLAAGRDVDTDRWSPRAGVALRVSPATVVRAAAFRQLNTNFFGSYIAPPTLAGFVIARNEFQTARRREVAVAVEQSRSRAFLGVTGFVRRTRVPYLLAEGFSFIPEADALGAGSSLYLNVIATRRATVFAENQFVRLGAAAFDRYDNAARLGVTVIHPAGVFFRAAGTFVRQRFTDTAIPDLPRSDFVLVDLTLRYEFAGKRGLANLNVTNVFDRRFASVIEGLAIDPFIPDRRAFASLRWRLW